MKFCNAGQVCVTPNRVFVESSVRKVFQQKVLERAQSLKLGFDRHADIDMGPLIDALACQRVDQEALGRGATLLIGGGRPRGMDQGLYNTPTVLVDIDSTMRP